MEDRNRKLSSEDIEAWQQALKNVGGISGKESKKYSGDGALIQAVVHEVVVRLETRRRPVTEDLVGMGDQIAAINKLLDIGPGAVRLIAIYGMGGIDDAFKSLIKWARKLKVLTIEHNDSIHGTPTFPEDSVLEKLTICDNSYFWKIDRSIGNLRCLTNLSVESCPKLRKLPEQIGELRSLQHLSLRSCFRLIELPDSVSKLELLMKLDVSYTGIKRLPDSIGRLPSLSFVVASGTLIEKLPSTMSEFRQLQTLDLIGCDGIQELPKLPRSLTTLLLRSTSLLIVPNLSDLTNLVELVLSDRSDSMAGSDIIQTCDLRWIGKLYKLSKLRFCFPNVHAPTIELGSLSQLEELTLYGLDLPTLEQLPSNLIVLELYDTRGKQVHYKGLPQLEKETVSSTSRKSRENKVHEQHDVQLLDVIESLERSHIQDCKSSERLACLPKELGCNELQAPELIDHWRGAFHFPSSLKMLENSFCRGSQSYRIFNLFLCWNHWKNFLFEIALH
ncbi:hypothetical protein NL676_007258 [Syzygium grande]|nr:hypothetical protein NL676_007258 [Syzygium grande]